MRSRKHNHIAECGEEKKWLVVQISDDDLGSFMQRVGRSIVGGQKSFSFLEGVNPDTASRIQIEECVFDMVYSQSSGLIYANSQFISGFKWDEKNKTLHKQFETSIQDLTYSYIMAITLAPPDTSGGDQVYVSVGFRDEMKNVYRLGGRKLEKGVELADTSYIDDECDRWILASNTDRHILLIYPRRTAFIYIHVKEEMHGKVDLNQLNIPNNAWFPRIQLIGQLLILGNNKIHLCELIATESDAFIKSGSERGPIKSFFGEFAALSHVVGDEDKALHLFTARYKSRDCTEISEYKFSLSVSGSEFNQLPMQPIHTLTVKGKFHLYYLVNVNTSSSVLIAKGDPFFGKLTAVELLKAEVNHHVQLSSS